MALLRFPLQYPIKLTISYKPSHHTSIHLVIVNKIHTSANVSGSSYLPVLILVLMKITAYFLYHSITFQPHHDLINMSLFYFSNEILNSVPDLNLPLPDSVICYVLNPQKLPNNHNHNHTTPSHCNLHTTPLVYLYCHSYLLQHFSLRSSFH